MADQAQVTVGPRIRVGSMRRLSFITALFAACAPLSGAVRNLVAHDEGPPVMHSTLLARLQTGDLIFREGTEAVSDLVRAVDGSSTGWSHVGLLAGAAGQWMVVHAVPSEKPERTDGVVIDALEFFLDRRLARGVGVYRVAASNEQRTIAVNFALRQEGRPFRLKGADGGTNCTELVRDAYAMAGVDLGVAPTRLEIPLLAGDYLTPKALSESPKLRRQMPSGAGERQAYVS